MTILTTCNMKRAASSVGSNGQQQQTCLFMLQNRHAAAYVDKALYRSLKIDKIKNEEFSLRKLVCLGSVGSGQGAGIL